MQTIKGLIVLSHLRRCALQWPALAAVLALCRWTAFGDVPPTFPYQIDIALSANGQLNNPSGVAVDSSGNVYVADQYNNRIQKFDNSGSYQTQWGSSGTGNGRF